MSFEEEGRDTALQSAAEVREVIAAGDGSQEAQFRLLDALSTAELIVPLPPERADAIFDYAQRLREGRPVPFVMFESEGVKFVPLFTSTARAREALDRNGPFAVASVAAFVGRILASGVERLLIDPSPSAPGGIGLSKAGIEALAAWHEVESGGKRGVGSVEIRSLPRPSAESIVATLREIVAEMDGIEEAFVFELQVEPEKSLPALGLRWRAGTPPSRHLRSGQALAEILSCLPGAMAVLALPPSLVDDARKKGIALPVASRPRS